MTTFPWEKYDTWLTTEPCQSKHADSCICNDCHNWHKEAGLVEKNSLYSSMQCCIDEMDLELIEEEEEEYVNRKR